MVYESSYTSGLKPFQPDSTRGKWASTTDYVFACSGLAFKLDIFSLAWFYYYQAGGLALVPYIISLMLFVVPMMVINSFLGQFSSSGFISALRISPLFKGMGYVGMILNYSMLIYYTIFAITPLSMMFHSFNPNLPWSCENFEKWAGNFSSEEFYHICNQTNAVNPEEETTEDPEYISEYNYTRYHHIQLPSVMFFRKEIGTYFMGYVNEDLKLSWILLGCSLLFWTTVGVIFYKFQNVERMGKLLKYLIIATLSLMVIMIIRLSFLEQAAQVFKNFWVPEHHFHFVGVLTAPIYAFSIFSAGWGSIITFSSLNNFKTNIMNTSWIICLSQMLFVTAMSFISAILDAYIESKLEEDNNGFVIHEWLLYTSSGSALAEFEWANFWCILFYGMLTMMAIVLIVSQLLNLLISIFDEFEILRTWKLQVTNGIIGSIAMISIYFCTNHGVGNFTALTMDVSFTHMIMNLLLLLIVLWVYGRVRFQRDIQFMLGQPFHSWKIFCLRFVAPIALCIALLTYLLAAYFEHSTNSTVVLFGAIFFIFLPWISIPAYAIFTLFQTTGSILIRLKRSCRPTDWYPVESEDRQRYEEAMGNMDITHQLNEIVEEVP